MDRLLLREITAETILGIYEWERRVPQDVVIDLEVPCDVRRAAASDAIEATFDYKAIVLRVIEFLGQSQFHLLETLAEQVARLVIAEFKADSVRLTARKISAFRGLRDVSVTIERSAADFAAGR